MIDKQVLLEWLESEKRETIKSSMKAKTHFIKGKHKGKVDLLNRLIILLPGGYFDEGDG